MLPADPDTAPAELVRCFAEDWLDPAELARAFAPDLGYDESMALLCRAWRRQRDACRAWEADHPDAPRISWRRPLWRGLSPADELPHTGSRAGRF